MQIQSLYMVSKWSFAFTTKGLEDVLRCLKNVLMASPGRRLGNVIKKVVATSISDKSKTFLRPKLRRLYDVFVISRAVSELNHRDVLNRTSDWPICSQCTFSLPPENIRKPYIFLMFSGDRERVHWEQMGQLISGQCSICTQYNNWSETLGNLQKAPACLP